MTETLYVIIGVIVLIVIFAIAQSIKKSAYSKAVYSEVDKLEQGKQLQAQIQTQPEQVRENLAMMQIAVLKAGYKKSLTPYEASQAMIGAVNEMLNEQQDN